MACLQISAAEKGFQGLGMVAKSHLTHCRHCRELLQTAVRAQGRLGLLVLLYAGKCCKGLGLRVREHEV